MDCRSNDGRLLETTGDILAAEAEAHFYVNPPSLPKRHDADT